MKKLVLTLLLAATVLSTSACSGGENSFASYLAEMEKEDQDADSDDSEKKKKSGKSDDSEKENQDDGKKYDVDLSKNLKIGDFIQFGVYEQDNNVDNGPERIDWQVIEIQYGKILVLSKYALDSQPLSTDENVFSWDQCSLRNWLNQDFYDQAFSAKEKDLIQTSELTTECKEKVKTEDKVFLLSSSEKNHFMRTAMIDGMSSTMCYPTAYALERGVKATEKTENRCNWLLRNASATDNARSGGWRNGITEPGSKVTSTDLGIRPAMWLSYENVSLKDAEVGDIVFFGTIEQNTKVYSEDNVHYHYEDEPIPWMVLDVQDGKKLLISKGGLVANTYGKYSEKSPITWETSNVRKELNSYFYDEAFNDEEKALIKETTLTNPDNDVYGTDGGNDTTDKVFILSLPEVEKYFGGTRTEENPLRSCYASECLNGAGTNGYGNVCSWYTRTPGQDQSSVVFVDYYDLEVFGTISMEGCAVGMSGISVSRPAIWVEP